MSRQADLEARIRGSSDLVGEYETTIQTSLYPEEKARCRHKIDEQRALIEGYLREYRRMVGDAMPPDIAEIAAGFPESKAPPRLHEPEREFDPDELPEPGPLPPGSHLPFHRNALFTGRTEPLKRLARALLHDGATSTLVTQAVQGMGGVGKTQLAVEFAYRYGRFFHGVHWLNAAQPGTLGTEVAACGEAMALPGWPQEQPEQVARTLEEWRRGGPRLVVLDNLEDVEAARKWLARLIGGPVRVLVTARLGDWPGDLGLELLRLDVFERGESLAFLRRYLPEARATDAEVERLAKRLGDLPLALELAGRYLKRHRRVTVREYLERLEDIWNHPSMAGWREKLGSPTGHDLELAKTFALSWERVEEDDARRVFLLAGYCAPNQAIPCELLEQAAGLEREACDGALSVLTGLGLLEMEEAEAGPLVHPLLAEYARRVDSPGEGEKPESLPALADALATLAQQANQTGLPAPFAPLRPHVEVMAVAAENAGLEQAGVLWNERGYHLRMVAEYGGAREAYERALTIDERVFGPDHPEVATDVNNLGSVLQALGDLAGAREAYERALAIREQVLGENHPDTATTLNNLGSLLRTEGDYAQARIYLERALAVYEEVFGEQHPWVAAAVNNLGGVLKDLGDLAGAREALERALAIWRAVYGEEHPQVATAHNNLGSVLRALGDLAGAREAYERALAIGEATFGPDHPKVALRVNNLGSVLHDLGDLAGAREALERALAIDERVYGSDHPSVARDVNNLGSVLQDLGDLAGAREAFERALAIREAVYGREHPDTAGTLWWLGVLEREAGDVEKAREYFEETLRIFAKFLPPDHPRIRSVRRSLEGLG